MVPFLKTNTHFQIFKLNNNGLGIWGGTVVSNALLENAKLCKSQGKESSLRVVVCGRNRLENGSAPHWAEAFAAHGKLREVRLPQNGIRMEGIAAIAEGLSKNPTLEVLDLQDNTATKTGTRSITKHLNAWPDLRILNLSDCLLGGAGGIALTTSLSLGSNPKLEELKLQYGELDKRAVEILSTAITQHLTQLRVLELNGNRFDAEDECVEELRKALELHGNEDALDDREFKIRSNANDYSPRFLVLASLMTPVHGFAVIDFPCAYKDSLTSVDDMEEYEEEDEDEEEEEAREEEEEETGVPDDGVDVGAAGEDKLAPVTDKDEDE